MINTYQTSLPPPPVPPRLGRHQIASAPVLSLKSGPSKPVFRFVIGIVVLHLILSFGGFVYLYHSGNQWQDTIKLMYQDEQNLQRLVQECKQNVQSQPGCRQILNEYNSVTKDSAGQGKVESLSGKSSYYGTMARMNAIKATDTSTSKYLLWDTAHSKKNNVQNNFDKDRLILKQSGDYFVFSRVTFSSYGPKSVLANFVKVWENGDKKTEKTLMKAYCSLVTRPGMCTASQAEVVSLNKGDQLGVWVEDPNLVDYEEDATIFGLYKL
ncbi:CD40 ligand [Osmerus mordax]|uniref:CD40 ligand n=1 Tax=Osmerus mordax TaxID=8014 RepID=UPI00350FA1E9